ncbi:MAG: dihydroorotase [Eubacteriales bacterium]
MILIIKNGNLAVSKIGKVEKGDLYIKDGKIAAIKLQDEQFGDTSGFEDADVIDVAGKLVSPGFIDLHVHFREPGFEDKETIHTGSMAAAAGGFTSVCIMPNTNPVIDCAKTLKYVDDKIRECAKINVFPIGSITPGQKGEMLADFASMVECETLCREQIGKGICAVSEDGRSVMNSALMLEAVKEAKKMGLSIFSHTEDETLRETAIGEELFAVRDMMLAQEADAHIHLCHISTKKCVDMIDFMKSKGVNVTAEVTPHHLVLSSDGISEDTNRKMNPPLRKIEDVKALRKALKNGIIDIIATDHAPHTQEEKRKPYEKAPNGIVGLETAFAVCYTSLVKNDDFSIMEIIDAMSLKPAQILGINSIGSLEVGKDADIAVIDIENPYIIDKTKFLSKGRNTPFDKMSVYGKIEKTLVRGEIVYSI